MSKAGYKTGFFGKTMTLSTRYAIFTLAYALVYQKFNFR